MSLSTTSRLLRPTPLLHSLQNGALLPSSKVTPLVHNLLRVSGPRYLLDGYPRTTCQAQSLFCDFDRNLRPQLVLLLRTDNENVLRERMRRRGRVDDAEGVVERRLREYEEGLKGILGVIEDNGGRIVQVECGDGKSLLEERVEKATQDVDRVCVMGPPAAGKGVVGDCIGEAKGRRVVAVGDVLRRLAGLGEVLDFGGEGLKRIESVL